MEPGGKEVKRTHHKVKAGRGAKERKKDLKAKKDGTRVDRHNPRAFSVSNIGRTQRNIQRNLDRAQQKEYVPLKDRRRPLGDTTTILPPPSLVIVMGPPQVGKSTLIRSLVKMYTGHNLTSIVGPITVVTGKNRRLTFFECPNDPAAMLDCAKIADLVLLVCDAKFGFEMETFEFLNMLQTHGFPKVFGVFTHLDQFKTTKNLQKTKTLLKQRFWVDIYEGAKMFYFSGCINGKYLKNEVKQLTLFIARAKVQSSWMHKLMYKYSSMKSTSHCLLLLLCPFWTIQYRPLIWRNTHPYVLIDRHEDVTHPNLISDNPQCNRSVTFYGYVRGTQLKPGMRIHLIGVGDFVMTEISLMPDPCPAPTQEKKSQVRRCMFCHGCVRTISELNMNPMNFM